MIDTLTATNMDTLDSLTINDLTYPLVKFAWDYQMKGEAEPNMQKPGRHDALKLVDFMTLEIEGSMMADPSENYWDIRSAFMDIFLPHIDAIALNHVRFDMVLSGSTTTLYVECTLADMDAPVEALSPTRSEFRFSYEIPFGYWRDDSTQAVVYI